MDSQETGGRMWGDGRLVLESVNSPPIFFFFFKWGLGCSLGGRGFDPWPGSLGGA